MTVQTIDQYLDLAQKQQEQGKLDEVATTYRQAILEFPQNYQLYNNLGKVLTEQGNLTAAIAIFDQGIKIRPHFSWLYYHLAEALKKQGNLTAAIVNYQQAIKLEDDVYWFHFYLGQALSEQDNYTQAIVSYQNAIDRGMKSPWIYYALGQAFTQQGDLYQAIALYQQGIEINPNLSSFYENIYFLKRKIAQDSSGIDSINNSYAQDSSQPDQLTLKLDSLQNQAVAFTEKKDWQSALACYQEIIQLDSDYGAVFYKIGQIYEQLNQINTAQEYYRQASILEDFSSDSNVLLVCFSARHITPKCRYHFLDFMANFPGKKLFVRDIQDAWYNKGLPGITRNVEQTSIYLKNIIDQQDIEKIVFLGASSGGYAALLFGYLLDVDEIHAFGAQTKIPNSPEEIALLTDLESSYFDLATVYQKKSVSSNCHLYFDNQFPPDREHAHHLKQITNLELHGYEAEVGHKISLWLKHQGLLSSIILNAFSL